MIVGVVLVLVVDCFVVVVFFVFFFVKVFRFCGEVVEFFLGFSALWFFLLLVIVW